MTERTEHVLRWPVDAVELDEELGCLVVRLDDEQALRLMGVLWASLQGVEPMPAAVMGGDD